MAQALVLSICSVSVVLFAGVGCSRSGGLGFRGNPSQKMTTRKMSVLLEMLQDNKCHEAAREYSDYIVQHIASHSELRLGVCSCGIYGQRVQRDDGENVTLFDALRPRLIHKFADAKVLLAEIRKSDKKIETTQECISFASLSQDIASVLLWDRDHACLEPVLEEFFDLVEWAKRYWTSYYQPVPTAAAVDAYAGNIRNAIKSRRFYMKQERSDGEDIRYLRIKDDGLFVLLDLHVRTKIGKSHDKFREFLLHFSANRREERDWTSIRRELTVIPLSEEIVEAPFPMAIRIASARLGHSQPLLNVKYSTFLDWASHRLYCALYYAAHLHANPAKA